MFVCSCYLPKCSKDVEGPILPCREVCDQFVDDCHKELKDSGLYRRYVAYCRLLSSKREASMQCLKPAGFVPRPNKKEPLLPSCETASRPACLKDNFSGLGNNTRNRLRSFLSDLSPVLNSSCSVKLRRFACFIETAPCVSNDGSTLHACPSMCQEVRRDCDEEFKRHNIDFPQCIPYYPEIHAGDGLCKLSHWPLPWPNTTETQVLETTPRILRTNPVVISKVNGGFNSDPNKESKIGTTAQSKPDSDKEYKKKPISSLVLAVAVVGFLMVVSFVTFMLHLLVKRLRKNARARRRGSGKYVKDANISSNGKAVTVGEEKNAGFEEEIQKTGTALY
ncbi:uncharacterized protein LOC111331550 [Stylophora pistillata]|uniref:FZ domain-containing protein n=1 Tax=Stylophora pistillata TaxID=50429 RepID=A0A2B4SX47_STYPI|nr:uncharacterized protein LOC111331550 [Stylophora pistillata]PFX33906.1 hypothetical protein AWC38_SpisGene1175 [Stylophora pistillata]